MGVESNTGKPLLLSKTERETLKFQDHGQFSVAQCVIIELKGVQIIKGI